MGPCGRTRSERWRVWEEGVSGKEAAAPHPPQPRVGLLVAVS